MPFNLNFNRISDILLCNKIVFAFPEKLVANYGSLQTFFAGSTSESDKFLQRQEPERRIRYSSTHAEVEDIMTAGVEKKMKTRKNVEEEVVEWWNKRPAK